MKDLIDHLKKILEEEKQEVVGYIKDRPAIINDIIDRELFENPDFKEEDISDEFMLDWIDTMECMDDYENSMRDAAYLR